MISAILPIIKAEKEINNMIIEAYYDLDQLLYNLALDKSVEYRNNSDEIHRLTVNENKDIVNVVVSGRSKKMVITNENNVKEFKEAILIIKERFDLAYHVNKNEYY